MSRPEIINTEFKRRLNPSDFLFFLAGGYFSVDDASSTQNPPPGPIVLSVRSLSCFHSLFPGIA